MLLLHACPQNFSTKGTQAKKTDKHFNEAG